MKRIENHVHFGANLDVGDGFALDVVQGDTFFQLFPVNQEGRIVPAPEGPCPRLVLETLGEKGVFLPSPNKQWLNPGRTIEINFVGKKVKITANAKAAITLNGKAATLYSTEIEATRFGKKKNFNS